ncbi:tRNA (adenosine(37)-N6)-threonylcarbamoyltransferase complex ATPase subunit type 1 TsaE [Desulfosediminicola flagellatus]|uniref:tRNA (adenosine(37)-N6)-threonylcarbamoyltransferase complex ATPase subunit type 1 TsaE n=1 Tax=Desulfosediminicola flagellatus TaxID=2569541 RepID=UPI0010AB941D|nr:tRNA (adenosine(37)-N6)-threonylcarbamoyltransferase complex ATPase subunit type 1 TsaE [Desulfosediminicola flagellatus]
MEVYIIDLSNLEETERFGIAIGKLASPGDVLCLDGDLGAGKTTLTQAIAVGLEVPGEYYVTSPSFAIFHEYPGRLPLYHMDFYRLGDYTEVEDLGFDEYFYLSGITVIEWSERAMELLPDTSLKINLAVVTEMKRKLTLSFSDSQWHKKLEVIASQAGLRLEKTE